MPAQLEIDGIGQHLATLTDWKKENQIYSFNSPGMDHPWSAWDEIESPHDFGHTYGFDAMGFGKTEKSAILDYCKKEQISIPFWWNN